MAERVVIDASIALALVRHEPLRTRIRAAIRVWIREDRELLVPGHFWSEVVNVLVRKHRASEREVLEHLASLDELLLLTVPLDRPTLVLALLPMTRFGLSAYDAVYLALAMATDARLATLDRRLAEAAGERAILFTVRGSRRVQEERAAYGVPAGAAPAWLASAEVGRYLAELRRQALVGDVASPAPTDRPPSRPSGTRRSSASSASSRRGWPRCGSSWRA